MIVACSPPSKCWVHRGLRPGARRSTLLCFRLVRTNTSDAVWLHAAYTNAPAAQDAAVTAPTMQNGHVSTMESAGALVCIRPRTA